MNPSAVPLGETAYAFVRHAEPAIDRTVPSSAWSLSEAGRGAAARLAAVVASVDITAVVTSDETKAVETAEHVAKAANLGVTVDPRLREVERPWIETGFADRAARYLNGEPIEGWEDRDAVVDRVRDALRDAGSGGPIAAVTHGTAMTVYLATVTRMEPVAFWSALTLPDAWLLAENALKRLVP